MNEQPEGATGAPASPASDAAPTAAPSTEAVEAVPAPLQAAVMSHKHTLAWSLVAVVANLLAAVASFSHNARVGLCWGSIALGAGLTLLLLNRVGAAVRSGRFPFFRRLTAPVISVAGVGFSFLALAVALSAVTRKWRGVELWDELYLVGDGAVAMSASLAVAFLALAGVAVACPPRARRRLVWLAPVLGLSVFAFGPALAIEGSSSSDLRSIYFKRTLLDMVHKPIGHSVLLKMKGGQGPQRDAVQTCVVLEQYQRLIFGWQQPVGPSEYESLSDAEAALDATTRCGSAVRDALAKGGAPESALFHGKLDDYFNAVRADAELWERPVALEPRRLPGQVGKALLALVDVEHQLDYSPFDLALATGRKADIQFLADVTRQLQPYQRHAVVVHGMQERLDRLGVDTENGLNAKLASIDYVYANRHCDARYASYLHGRGVVFFRDHVRHLTSLIGRAQYPNRSSEAQDAFPHANDDFGLPDANQLEGCVALAAFYAQHLKEMPDNEYAENPLVGDVFADAAAAAFQWWVRDVEAWRKAQGIAPRVQDATVRGRPEVAFEVAQTLLSAIPTSFDHYCQWTLHWHSWMYLTRERRPELTRSLRDMAERWKESPPALNPEAQCQIDLPWNTEQFHQDYRRALAALQADLRQLGFPCRVEAVKPKGLQVVMQCRGSATR